MSTTDDQKLNSESSNAQPNDNHISSFCNRQPPTLRQPFNMAMLAMPQKRTGRLDLGNALAAWLRGNTGPHVHQSPGAAAAIAEASWLRNFIAEPLGTLEDLQDKSLRCAPQCSHFARMRRHITFTAIVILNHRSWLQAAAAFL